MRQEAGNKGRWLIKSIRSSLAKPHITYNFFFFFKNLKLWQKKKNRVKSPVRR